MREFDSMNRINIVSKVRQQNSIDVVLYSYQLLKLIFFCKFTFGKARNLVGPICGNNQVGISLTSILETVRTPFGALL